MSRTDQYMQLQDKGWSLMDHQLPQAAMESIVEHKNTWLRDATKIVERHLGIGLERFDEKNLAAHELVKGMTRAFLRYDPEVHRLGAAVYDQLKLQAGNTNEIAYATLPYPIIHLPVDTSEKGPKHKDGYYYIRNFQTTWSPLNDCNHEAISVTENSHRTPGFLERKLKIKLLRPETQVVKPKVKCGEFLTWYGSTDHEGLLNTSGETSVAIVYRFTSTPIMLEATTRSAILGRSPAKKDPMPFDEFCSKMLMIYDAVNLDNSDPGTLADMYRCIKHIEDKTASWKLPVETQHKAAFMLTLLAQRMEAHQAVPVFYAYACALSGHLVYPVQQLTKYLLEKTSVRNAEEFMRWTLRNNGDRQHGFILKERMADWNSNHHPHAYLNIPEGLPLLDWNH